MPCQPTFRGGIHREEIVSLRESGVTSEIWMTLQCCNLGSEYDLGTEHPVIERLFAETVAHQMSARRRAVAKRKGEHSSMR
jgi:hypothetical protein